MTLYARIGDIGQYPDFANLKKTGGKGLQIT
jgi:hypothetical protein